MLGFVTSKYSSYRRNCLFFSNIAVPTNFNIRQTERFQFVTIDGRQFFAHRTAVFTHVVGYPGYISLA